MGEISCPHSGFSCNECAGFSPNDFQDFYKEILEEMVKLGKTPIEAENLTEDRFRKRNHSWLLFHDPPEHWAKLVVLGHGYWRKD